MKFVVALDSFKGCLTSVEAGNVVTDTLHELFPESKVQMIPVSDGGEGMLNAFVAAVGGFTEQLTVHGPDYHSFIQAELGYTPDGTTAIIEMARASGLGLSSRRDALNATSYGTGELIRHAVCQRGCRKLVIGLGGSACTDGGAGMLVAMGLDLRDEQGNRLHGFPSEIHRLSVWNDEALRKTYADVECLIASDVNSPLYGPQGSAYVFAPQKGATPQQVKELDAYLHTWADWVRRYSGTDFALFPGAGAAGGVGFALLSYLRAKLKPGADVLLDKIKFDDLLVGVDWVFTGEGSSDAQTLMGKLPQKVLLRAQQQQIPVCLLAGQIHQYEVLKEAGFACIQPITPKHQPLSEALLPVNAKLNLRWAVQEWKSCFVWIK